VKRRVCEGAAPKAKDYKKPYANGDGARFVEEVIGDVSDSERKGNSNQDQKRLQVEEGAVRASKGEGWIIFNRARTLYAINV